MLTITHTHADGTLVDGTSRNDGTAHILKAHRFRWGRTIGAWYLPASRDRFANTYAINTAAEALRSAGHEVTVTVDDTPRPVEQAEADLAHRLDDRATALATRAERAAATANAARDRATTAHNSLPEWGEPIKVGHHSEERHRAAITKAHDTMRQAIDAATDAHEIAHRADVAAAANDRRNQPTTVANRIAKAHADVRRLKRLHTRYSETPVANHPGAADSRAAHLERLATLQAHAAATAAYWTEVHDRQIADGITTNHTRDTIEPGDHVQISGTWWRVKRTNAKSVNVDGAHGSNTTAPYHHITAHRPATK